VTPRRRLAAASLALGLGVAILARLGDPLAPPLYDGVVVVEPYLWLEPPPGERGGAQGVSDTLQLEDGASPLLAIATPEQPPQAQIFAPRGALTLAPGSRSLSLSITPIPPPAEPPDGYIAGNAYRFSVTDQDGSALTAPADAFVTVVMRGPEDTTLASISRFQGGAWVPLATSHAGYTSAFLAIVTEFGDLALIAPGTAPWPGPAPTPGEPAAPGGPSAVTALVAAAIGALLVILVLVAYRSVTRGRTPPAGGSSRRGAPSRRSRRRR
jgi:hypothetical protein